ncbi:hypothetical protein TCE0_041f14114 [Talaromyces pinophilus]|uniref:Xylanolytic transcriptional activator regulatory domain-containing protein n=1 Tax=Talaromyces pinophilus TaxID=128442 RepID=A0A6V8HHS5_TALPI|nr:hypothetical protein TCE0_041f14114 [Talaromyces pinophilus]
MGSAKCCNLAGFLDPPIAPISPETGSAKPCNVEVELFTWRRRYDNSLPSPQAAIENGCRHNTEETASLRGLLALSEELFHAENLMLIIVRSVMELSPAVMYAMRRLSSANILWKTASATNRPPNKRYVESLCARIKTLEDQLTAAGRELSAFQLSENLDTNRNDCETQEPDQRDPVWEILQLVGRLNLRNPTPGTWLAMQKQGLDAARQLNKLVFICEELQDHLLDPYWKWQNASNYIVYKSAFMRDLRAGHGKFCSLLLLAILAIASRYSNRLEVRSVPDDLNSAGDAFVDQAKIPLLDESEAPTVTTVQAAALLSLRVMSDNQDALGWLYGGMLFLWLYHFQTVNI